MPFGAHESMEVHEVLTEKINMIDHFAMYAQQAQSSELMTMLENHLQETIHSYDELVSYTHDYNQAVPVPTNAGMPAADYESIRYALRQPAPVGPQAGGTLDDRQIATAVLLAHKNSAKNHITAALECADPNIRQMLLNGAVICTNFAYEIFLYMNREGMYQVPTMRDHTAKTMLHAFQPSQPQMAEQPYLEGSSGQENYYGSAAQSQTGGYETARYNEMSAQTMRQGGASSAGYGGAGTSYNPNSGLSYQSNSSYTGSNAAGSYAGSSYPNQSGYIGTSAYGNPENNGYMNANQTGYAGGRSQNYNVNTGFANNREFSAGQGYASTANAVYGASGASSSNVSGGMGENSMSYMQNPYYASNANQMNTSMKMGSPYGGMNPMNTSYSGMNSMNPNAANRQAYANPQAGYQAQGGYEQSQSHAPFPAEAGAPENLLLAEQQAEEMKASTKSPNREAAAQDGGKKTQTASSRSASSTGEKAETTSATKTGASTTASRVRSRSKSASTEQDKRDNVFAGGPSGVNH
ncbi:spore coat protein [Paenibacillus turpanensis]|uniref:spore coat protein n=1 Tax=Paenibacillus turpanensis TaxID=2689078 RepID=UPI00140C0E11|nr:spore coat protein [Paenibacillus turpanensis]